MKKSIILVAALVLVCVSLLATETDISGQSADTIFVNPHHQYQTIEGWGTSLAWWANIVGGWESGTRDQLMDDLFSVEDGIGLNVVRYNIGGGINEPLEGDNYRIGADIPSYQPEENQWDWQADKRQRWVLNEAFARDANIAEAFSNSPPYWMTYDQCASGAHDGGVNLDSDYMDAFAEYLVDVVEFIEGEDGITFHSLSPFNEPISDWWVCGNNQEGSHFDIETQESMIQATYDELQNRDLFNIVISGPEEYSIQQTIDSYQSYDSDIKELVGQINTHAYDATGRSQLQGMADNDNKDLWMSEVTVGGNVGYDPSRMDAGALELSQQILEDMTLLQPSVWVYWQAVEDQDRAQEYDHSHGLSHAPFTGEETYDLAKQYYVMGNYSKFMRPGHQVIRAGDSQTLASYDQSNEMLVLVTTNDSSTERHIDFDLTQFSQVSGDATPYQTSNSADLAQLPNIEADTNGFSATVPADSVTTFVLSGVVPGEYESEFDPDSKYAIINRNSDKVLDVYDESTENGAEIVQWTGHGGTNQQWSITNNGEGYYEIENENSGLLLDVDGESIEGGADIIQWPYNGGENQQWSIIDIGDGYYEIQNRNSSLLLDVDGASTEDGARVIQWPYNGGTNQQWSIIEVE